MMYLCAKMLFLTMPLWQQGCEWGKLRNDESSNSTNPKKDNGDDPKQKDTPKKNLNPNNQGQTQSLKDQMQEVGQHLNKAFVDLGDAMEQAGTGFQIHFQTAIDEIEKVIEAVVEESKPTGKTAEEIFQQIFDMVIDKLNSAVLTVVKNVQTIDWAAAISQDTQQNMNEFFTDIGKTVTKIGDLVTDEVKDFDADNKISESVTRELNNAVEEIKKVAVNFVAKTQTFYGTAKDDVEDALQNQELHDALIKITDKMHTIFQDVMKKSKFSAEKVWFEIGKTVSKIGKTLKMVGPYASNFLDEVVKAGEDIHQIFENAVTMIENSELDQSVGNIWADIVLKTFDMTEDQLIKMIDSAEFFVLHLKDSVSKVIENHWDGTKAQDIIQQVAQHLDNFADKVEKFTKKIYQDIVKDAEPMFKEILDIVEKSWSQIQKDTDIRDNLVKVELLLHDTLQDAMTAANTSATVFDDTIQNTQNFAGNVINEIADHGQNVYNNVAPTFKQVIHELTPEFTSIFNDIKSIF